MNRADRRDIDRRKALRKKHLSENFWSHASDYPYYDNLHQYSKNKIHCSCPDCSEKTRNKGHRRKNAGNYDRSINHKHSELKKIKEISEWED